MNAIEAALEGRVGKAPVLRTSQAGKPWCSFSVAVGSDQDEGGATWVNVTAFGDLATEIATLEKGARVYVEGKLRLKSWKGDDGREHTGLQVTAWLVQPLGQIGRRKPASPARVKAALKSTADDISDWQRPFDQPQPRDRSRLDEPIPF